MEGGRGMDGDVVVDNIEKTINITMNIYYNRKNKELNFYVANSDGKGYDQLERARQKGFSSKSWEHIDSDNNKWMISFNMNFIPLESDDEVEKALNGDPVANKLLYNEDLNAAGKWDPKTKEIKLGVGSWWRMGIENDAGTLSHEIGHALGLDDHKNTHDGESGDFGIMSYSLNRTVQQSEVSSIASRILKVASNSHEKQVHLRLFGSLKRDPVIINK